MIRLIVVALVCYGAAALIGRLWPESAGVWFTIFGFGFTYVLVGCIAAGGIAWRVTK